jgi:hypothetical protein
MRQIGEWAVLAALMLSGIPAYAGEHFNVSKVMLTRETYLARKIHQGLADVA